MLTTAGCVHEPDMLLAHVASCRQATNWRTPSRGAPATAARTASSADAAALRSKARCMGPCQYSAADLQSLHRQAIYCNTQSLCNFALLFSAADCKHSCHVLLLVFLFLKRCAA